MSFIFKIFILLGMILSLANANKCGDSFQGVINSTGGKVTLIWGANIHHSNEIITKEWEYNPSGIKCDGGICTKSNTIVPRYQFNVDLGDGTDGVFASSWNQKHRIIDGDRSFSKINFGWQTKLTINGDSTIKVQGKFELGGSSILEINGDVTIYADNFHMNYGSKLKINGKLTIISNTIEIYSTSTQDELSGTIIALSKGKIQINNNAYLRGLFYAEDIIMIASGSHIEGVLTANRLNINSGVNIYADKDIVSNLCSKCCQGCNYPDPTSTNPYN